MRPALTPALVLLAACLAACCVTPGSTRPPPGADEAVAAYAARLLAGDPAGARELLAEPLRNEIGEAELAGFVAAGGAELRAALRAAGEGPLRVTAFRVRLPDGAEVEVRPGEDGRLRLAGGALCPAPQGSPAAAVLAFARALEAGDCEALLATAPPATVARLGAARLGGGCRLRLEGVRGLARSLRAVAAGLPPPSGERLQVALGAGGRLVLVRQGERWYVEDVDVPAAAGEGGDNP